MNSTLKLIKNADIYAPEHIGKADILICGDKIERIAAKIEGYDTLSDVQVINAEGMSVVPGFIDSHIHITGGGGEDGPSSRTPEIQLSDLVKNGVTTCVGLLGTDGITRSLENLLAKCRALNEEGVTCYILTGSYAYPSKTLTGDVTRDIVLIPEIIGAKTALSDHRASNLTKEELIRLASEVRAGGLISGKAGVLCMHIGVGKKMIDLIFEALSETDIPAKTFFPTHLGRNAELADQAVKLSQLGGMIDLTANDPNTAAMPAQKMLAYCLDSGDSKESICLSSDSCGSRPRFDDQGNCVGLDYTLPDILLTTLKGCVKEENIPLETALRFITANPAKVIGKTGIKGCISEGADADIVFLNRDLDIMQVYAKGKLAYKDGQTILKGRFEK